MHSARIAFTLRKISEARQDSLEKKQSNLKSVRNKEPSWWDTLWQGLRYEITSQPQLLYTSNSFNSIAVIAPYLHQNWIISTKEQTLSLSVAEEASAAALYRDLTKIVGQFTRAIHP